MNKFFKKISLTTLHYECNNTEEPILDPSHFGFIK